MLCTGREYTIMTQELMADSPAGTAPGDAAAEPPTASAQPPAAPTYKPNNPFSAPNYTTTHPSDVCLFPYSATSVPAEQLRRGAFKTSNRILDDLRLTPALHHHRLGDSTCGVASLLHARPIEYASLVASTLARDPHDMLVLNNAVAHIPAVAKTEHQDKVLTATTVRGLIVARSRREVAHFRVQILEKAGRALFAPMDKHEYHWLPRSAVSVDDLSILDDAAIPAENLLDDAFFKDLSSPTNHILRVSVYSPEFSAADLEPLTNQDRIKDRYLRGIATNPSTPLSEDTIPNRVHCFQTLVKVLKGPILLPPGEVIHTISKTRTSLDAKIDVDLLFSKLGFTLGPDDDSLVPPNLSARPALKEAYIRKAYELVFIGKGLKTNSTNDFDVTYSFSDNLSQVHSVLAEVDKHAALNAARGTNSNELAFLVTLSCYAFYQDELIIRCYENTVNSDPANKMKYVECFKSVMNFRASSKRLRAYYTIQFDKGNMFDFSDYINAIRAIGIHDISPDSPVDADTLIEAYKVACKDDPKNYTYFNKQLRTINAISPSDTLDLFLRNELVPTEIALNELSIGEVTEDEVVVTAYEFRLDDIVLRGGANDPAAAFLQKCLLSIAVGRKSYILMTYIENNIPELQVTTNLTFADALAILGVDRDTSDFEVITSFQEKLSTSSLGDEVDIRTLRSSLSIIAENKKSEILFSYLRQGKIDASLLPPENWPTGLDNIGNTCYLNSLLQYYFSIKPLRETILKFDETHVDTSKHKSRKIGGRFVEDSEHERSFQFIYRLQNLFEEMITTRKRCVQPSKELAYLSFLPLSQSVQFKDEAAPVDESNKENEVIEISSQSPEGDVMEVDEAGDKVDLILLSDDKVDEVDMDGEIPEPVHIENAELLQTTKLMHINAEQIESTIEVGRQQDVTECIENVTFQIETALEPERIEEDGEQYDLIKKLFSGKTKQTIVPLEGDGKKERVSFERFFSLIINVGDHPKDIYDALDNYFSEDVVHLEEGDVKKSLTIAELPEVLQFHVQRVMFDRERLMAYKSLEVIPFGETIYLDRYLDTDDSEIISKRQEVFEWKNEMKKLHEEKYSILEVDPQTKLTVVDALNATIKYLNAKVLEHSELNIKQETIAALQAQVEVFKIRLQAIHTRLETLQGKVSLQFSTYQKVGYSLFAIFIHRGEASYGHYWVYIKDPKRNIYRKYNDDTVTEVPLSEVLNFTESNTATPYYMVFVKKELEEAYVEPLKRVFEA